MRIRVSTVVPASPAQVWADVRDIASHVDWMADAQAIRFTGYQRSGVGTEFECDTKLGPSRLTDRMAVTEWDVGRVLGIRHRGWVEGTGRFTLKRTVRGRTRFTWAETLRFPWWMGGPVGALVAKPVLRMVWTRNLRRLRRRFAVSADRR
jgi:hypothetical protein